MSILYHQENKIREQIKEVEKMYQESGNIAVIARLYSEFEVMIKNLIKSRDEWAERLENLKDKEDNANTREYKRTASTMVEVKHSVCQAYLKAYKKLFTKYGYDIVSAENSDPDYIKPEYIADETESIKRSLQDQLNKNLK